MRRPVALLLAAAILIMAHKRSTADGGSESLDAYYELRLSPALRDAALKLLGGKIVTVTERQELKSRILAARRFTLPDVEIDWDQAEAKARRRGESVADLIYDEGTAKEPQ